MTELSYTAWDDNKYQWPPPDGWYQASDGKWWPEGYGPVVNQAAATQAVADTSDHASESAAAPGSEESPSESADQHLHATQEVSETGTVDHTAVEHTAIEHEAAGYESGYTGAVVEGAHAAESTEDAAVAAAAEEYDEAVGTASEVAANGSSEHAVVESDHAADLDGAASGYARTFDTAPETAHPTESEYGSESRYSTSSAGMAASGFASHAEGGSSSLGLAGWAQTGASDVRNRVDVSHEYDYSPGDDENDGLLDPTEASEHDHDLDATGLDTSDGAKLDASALETADLEASDLAAAHLHDSGLDTSTYDTPAHDAPAYDAPAYDTPTDDAPAYDTPTFDTAAEPVDATLSRLDDLKRQVEQQDVSNQVGSAGATAAVSDLDAGGFDPTETLDIDPNDLTLESNPYYGGAEEADSYGAAPGTGVDESVNPVAYNGDYGTADAGTDHGYVDHAGADQGGYGFGPVGDATIEAPSAAETRQYGYEGEPAPPLGDQPLPAGDGYGAPQTDYSTSTLSPMSAPTPKPGPGRMVLYAIIGLLALAVAGVAGYLLFQLQTDDGASGGDTAATAGVGGGDAGPSDLSGQEPGAFSNPHELAGGVRLTVPVGDEGTEVWMLQVREPATSSDLGDELVEVTSRIRIRNDSPSGDLSASGLRFVLVSADGSTGTTASESCSAGDDLDRQAAIEPGKDIEGNVCWTVPAAQATGALLGVESVHAAGRVHVQLS